MTALKKMLQRITHSIYHAVFGIMTSCLGWYILVHHDYLDDPHQTWQPIPDLEKYAGFADDIWFGTIILIIGLGLLVGVLCNVKWLKRYGMFACAGVYFLLCFAFGIRGLIESYFNLAWVTDVITAIVAIKVASSGNDDA